MTAIARRLSPPCVSQVTASKAARRWLAASPRHHLSAAASQSSRIASPTAQPPVHAREEHVNSRAAPSRTASPFFFLSIFFLSPFSIVFGHPVDQDGGLRTAETGNTLLSALGSPATYAVSRFPASTVEMASGAAASSVAGPLSAASLRRLEAIET